MSGLGREWTIRRPTTMGGHIALRQAEIGQERPVGKRAHGSSGIGEADIDCCQPSDYICPKRDGEWNFPNSRSRGVIPQMERLGFVIHVVDASFK